MTAKIFQFTELQSKYGEAQFEISRLTNELKSRKK